jgi:hypothetical protein
LTCDSFSISPKMVAGITEDCSIRLRKGESEIGRLLNGQSFQFGKVKRKTVPRTNHVFKEGYRANRIKFNAINSLA